MTTTNACRHGSEIALGFAIIGVGGNHGGAPRSMPGAEMGDVIATAIAEASAAAGSSFAIGVCLTLQNPLKVGRETLSALLIRFATPSDMAALDHVDLVDHVRCTAGAESGLEARFNREQALDVLEYLTGIDASDLRQLRAADGGIALGLACALWRTAFHEGKTIN